MHDGWLKLYRSLLDHELLSFDNTAYILFTKLLLIADKNTGKYTTGRHRLSALTNMPESTAWGALKRLELHKIVRLQTDSSKTTILICNWTKYQGTADSRRTEARQQTDTKQEEEKKYIDKSIYGDSEINGLFDYWEEHTGLAITTQVTRNRQACSSLRKKHGVDGVKKLITLVARSHSDKFSPTVSNFIQLRDKENQILIWAKKQVTVNEVVKI